MRAPRVDQSEDDLRVEVETVRIRLHGKLLQGRHSIGAVAAVPLAQLGTRHRVLVTGQDLVAHVLVQGHATLAGGAASHHARTEHGIGPVHQQWRQHIKHHLGCVLTITVQQHHDIKTHVGRQLVAGLLIAPIAQVHRMTHHVHRQLVVGALVSKSGLVRVIKARVITHDDAFNLGRHFGWNSVERRGKRRLRVVGNDQNTDSGTTEHAAHGGSVPTRSEPIRSG